ncbi:hypothetical protein QBC35DRAFT_453407 [Podospora australis]|uniref:Rhodopsin domain-containing protein n=1 Tax=Podospora australis TaxID=1536484 RepID=A0AAN7AHL4_9PEZI|nr:hypothetical protein QBC35DRAFT_453407 [Podospora australis]
MKLYSDAPAARPFSEDKPTLLISWWITFFCACIILLRLLGRFVRVERLFREDKVAAWVFIPLFLRMAFVHPILVFGTNNVLVEELSLSDEEIRRRALGSVFVLVSRIIYPAILWLLKLVTLEFFDRLIGGAGARRYTCLLRILRFTLLGTFVAVIISNLAECMPFSNYWQVTPDPGPRCRQGYAYLITVTVCNVLTDLVLVVFPVPIVIQSRLSTGHKTLLVSLFCLHIFTAVVAICRVPKILNDAGAQATRTSWASVEILMATFAANALTIGTFVRDKGVKKKKFRYEPQAASLSRSDPRTTTKKKVAWGEEEEDTEGEMGFPKEGKELVVVGASVGRSPPATPTQERGAGSKETLSRGGGGSDRDGDLGISHRTASMDSLIPRSRSIVSGATPALPNAGNVIKTTTIQVTVTSAPTHRDEHYHHQRQLSKGLRLTPVDGAVTATARGRTRGSSILLRDMRNLPDRDVEEAAQR